MAAIRIIFCQICMQYSAARRRKVPWYKLVWNATLPIKITIFMWELAWRRISTADRVHKFQPSIRTDCFFCASYLETLEHLFFTCGIIQTVRAQFFITKVNWLTKNQMEEWCTERPFKEEKDLWGMCFPAMLWAIWRERNNSV